MEKKFKKRLDKLINEIEKYDPDFDRDLLTKAYRFSYNTHKEQLRLSGKPYFLHCVEVAKIMVELKTDLTTVVCGLLHDTIEDSGITKNELKEEFSDEIAEIVDGVTKIGEIRYKKREEQQVENFRKMLLSMINDIRVILVKFGDRVNNMRTLEYLPPQKRELIAIETLEIYAPLAHRLGISRISWELEDLSLKFLDPEAYQELVRKVKGTRKGREKYLEKIEAPLLESLKNAGINAQIEGRAKHFYSIYKKMKKRNCSFEEIYDLFAVRIIVDKLDECYYTLGIVHTLYPPIRERFKDFIATPKLNRYQSIHTTVIGPEGRRLEIQIRTHEMHYNADFGIASHWRYKEEETSIDKIDKQMEWLRTIMEWQNETSDPKEFLENLKVDLFQEELFVFTPKGDLLKLPIGATPIDFAFEVHTDIGLHCIGAKVNGNVVPLDTKLQSGDTVEILTSTAPKPNPNWITFAKTSKARSLIKKWLKSSLEQQSIKLGEELLLKVLNTLKIKNLDESLEVVAEKMGFSDIQSLYSSIGKGEVNVGSVIRRLPEENFLEFQKKRFISRTIKRMAKSQIGIRLLGIDNMLIEFGKCCHPVPGDKIQGLLVKGKGVTIHRSDCSNVYQHVEETEKLVPVVWDEDSSENYIVSIKLVGEDRLGFLKDVATAVSELDTNIINANLEVRDSIATNTLMIEVKNLHQLTNIIRNIRKVKGVISVERFDNSEKKY